ncbi:hypothetical protein [Microbacterium aurum]
MPEPAPAPRLGDLLSPGTPGGADAIVWIDHPRRVVMRRVVGRTIRRALTREELWHGNRERPSRTGHTDPTGPVGPTGRTVEE